LVDPDVADSIAVEVAGSRRTDADVEAAAPPRTVLVGHRDGDDEAARLPVRMAELEGLPGEGQGLRARPVAVVDRRAPDAGPGIGEGARAGKHRSPCHRGIEARVDVRGDVAVLD